jgi:hypothetical protein
MQYALIFFDVQLILAQMPSEVVTLGLLHALKGGGNRPFYRWLTVRRESAL